MKQQSQTFYGTWRTQRPQQLSSTENVIVIRSFPYQKKNSLQQFEMPSLEPTNAYSRVVPSMPQNNYTTASQPHFSVPYSKNYHHVKHSTVPQTPLTDQLQQQQRQIQQTAQGEVSSGVRTYIQRINIKRPQVRSSQSTFGHTRSGSQNNNQNSEFNSTHYGSQTQAATISKTAAVMQTEEAAAAQVEDEAQQTPYISDLFYLNFLPERTVSTAKNSAGGARTTTNSKQQLPAITIPGEQEIDQTYRFRLPTLISKMENENSSIGLLNGWHHNFVLIEKIIKEAEQRRDDFIQEKSALREEIKNVQLKFDKELDEIKSDFEQQLAQIPQRLREDYIKHQEEQFRLNKELTVLCRDKSKIEEKIQQALAKVNVLESRMYGACVFDLVPNDPQLQEIVEMNQRDDEMGLQLMTIKSVIH